jgi:hypothetical protein
MLGGCDRLYKTQDVMQPITFEILQKLHNALHHVCTLRYEMVLFQTAFCISFAAFLRVGEMSLTSNSPILKQTKTDTWLTVTHLNGKTRDREFFVLVANIFPKYSKGKYYVMGCFQQPMLLNSLFDQFWNILL